MRTLWTGVISCVTLWLCHVQRDERRISRMRRREKVTHNTNCIAGFNISQCKYLATFIRMTFFLLFIYQFTNKYFVCLMEIRWTIAKQTHKKKKQQMKMRYGQVEKNNKHNNNSDVVCVVCVCVLNGRMATLMLSGK